MMDSARDAAWFTWIVCIVVSLFVGIWFLAVLGSTVSWLFYFGFPAHLFLCLLALFSAAKGFLK